MPITRVGGYALQLQCAKQYIIFQATKYYNMLHALHNLLKYYVIRL